MALTRLIYASRPFGFDEGTLMQILGNAQRNNARDDITGSLICREDMYLQLLEGPEAAVEAAYARIVRDDRHVEVTRLVVAPVEKRLFAAWAMRHDPVKSWMWTASEVAAGAIERATPDEVVAIFTRLASET